MRFDFDLSVPLWEQIRRYKIHSHTGHKHMHKVGPGRSSRSKESAKVSAQYKRLKQRIAAYWRGEIEEHP